MIYNSVLLAVMFALARILRLILQRTELHARFEFLNLYNKWLYFFNGHYADVDEFDVVFTDALVDTKEGEIIYSGFLVNFETKKW
jgi:hypothetical protein